MRQLVLRLVRDERIRFLAVGGTNTVIGYGLFSVFTLWLFPHVPFGYVISLVLSYAIAIVVAFVLYRRFVFNVRGHVVRDFARFVSVYAVSILINIAALPLLVEALHLLPLVAQAIVLIVTTLVSFVGHKLFSFRRSERDLARATAHEQPAHEEPAHEEPADQPSA